MRRVLSRGRGRPLDGRQGQQIGSLAPCFNGEWADSDEFMMVLVVTPVTSVTVPIAGPANIPLGTWGALHVPGYLVWVSLLYAGAGTSRGAQSEQVRHPSFGNWGFRS